jgi:hypothetical protein
VCSGALNPGPFSRVEVGLPSTKAKKSRLTSLDVLQAVVVPRGAVLPGRNKKLSWNGRWAD